MLDDTGLTIAISNYQQSVTFLGQNYGFRSYFQQAMKGELGRFFAIGATTSWPGYFVAAPVMVEGEVRHVAERRVLDARRGRESVAAVLMLADADDVPPTLREAVAVFERELIAKAVQAHGGRMDAVAESLGIGRRTLNEKIVKVGLEGCSFVKAGMGVVWFLWIFEKQKGS